MRAGALSDPSVAALLEEAFVCAWEKKGAVACYRVRGESDLELKVGGNILAYVCTPRGEVVHAIPGVWSPEMFLAELEWARDRHRELAGLERSDALARLRNAHRDRLPQGGRRRGQQLLSTQAFLPLAQVEKPFFETLLGEPYAPEKEIILREVSRRDLEALLASRPRR